MIVTANQPYFCPFPGFFYKVHVADVFVVLDDVHKWAKMVGPGGRVLAVVVQPIMLSILGRFWQNTWASQPVVKTPRNLT